MSAMRPAIHLLCVLLLGTAVSAPLAAQAAEGIDNCVGFVDSLPATISTPGVWCLRQDLSTPQAYGAAITVASNNVTFDCNDHAMTGLATELTATTAIRGDAGRLNLTVRRCQIQGFQTALYIEGDGAVIEDNRIRHSRRAGIYMAGDGALIRRNMISATRQPAGVSFRDMFGIDAQGMDGQVIGNEIHDVMARAMSATPTGAAIRIQSGTVAGNRISGLSGGTVAGIMMKRSLAVDNDIIQSSGADGPPIWGDGDWQSVCRGNRMSGFLYGPSGCLAIDNVELRLPAP